MNPPNFQGLVSGISETSRYFKQQAQNQVNVALTMRNWCIGYYLVEYEQHGADRAEYGNKTLDRLANTLKDQGFKGLGITNLKIFRQFYLSYPQIGQTLSDLLPAPEQFQSLRIIESTIDNKLSTHSTPLQTLVNHLSFSHIIELLKADAAIKRSFYENQAIKNHWSVRELQRAMNCMLYERTGLSSDKTAVLQKHATGTGLSATDVFRNPYMLEFLGLDEKSEYSESDLEQAIIHHLQTFLLEMGNGFCFEARQKRITFDNTHYRIDLVFYHRILKCHVLVDLKIGEFDHADAGQMNLYLNYYADQEMKEGDNPPVGIILCASHNRQLVKYATTGLAQQMFVSKYLVNLPTEDELKQIIQNEQEKYTG